MKELFSIILGQVPMRGSDVLVGAFGVMAALLLVGGPLLLRYQRNRQRFELLKASIEQGLPPMADGMPIWLRSLREGVGTLTLGLGLLIVGIVLYQLCAKVPQPAHAANSATEMRGGPSLAFGGSTTQPALPPDRGGRGGPPFGRGPGNDGPDGGMPGDMGPDHRPPEDRFPPDRMGGPRAEGGSDRMPLPRMRSLDPAEDSWHRAQDGLALALLALGGGFVLALLGLVRIFFARVEAKYSQPPKSQT